MVVEERLTAGAAENLALLLDPKSGVDVAFSMGGAGDPASRELEMLATLYYEPLWVFHRDDVQIERIDQMLFKRIAVGQAGTGTRAFTEALLAANGLTESNTDQRLLGNLEALRALQRGEIEVALMVGLVQTPAIWQALHDPSIRLMGIVRDEAYARRFPYVVRLKLPAGTIELGLTIPAQDVTLIGTKAMLVARPGLQPALINLLIDAAHEIHSGQGYFEAADEFPGTARVDIEVSAAAQRHKQFGPNLLHRYMPFWVATFVERLIILVVPLLVILVPLMNYLPQVMRWRLRARVYRWYGELKMLERDVAAHRGTPPIEKWLQHLDRIEHAAQEIKTPVSLASEAYTLREHVALVRRAIMAKAPA
ncbi:MAG: TAXI family TRAP transporter solute-binding subunit [Betaproteobacteria bacterium]